ncbi:hypothetical protein GCK72_003926 [Caenorhabditis remanei]|uniref:UNC93-like protein MFSD11 n=1 Tax=Caenorhabditis remanei TaxID=31234 RepID=A0A6A5H811_CAERE|nr:hypothetical protein GCK72_003926 [Caenorhabditis remanei]KAF1763980.1 hypothetical protein GCK72_003926 [Caenorhabditis remanei]
MPQMSEETINVLRVSISMMILFTAVLSHEFLMEPLLHGLAQGGIGGIQNRDGYMILCIMYFFNSASCFFAPYLVAKLTGKYAMVLGMVSVLCCQASFVFPQRIPIIATSVLVGVGTTFLWVGQGQYISDNVSDRNREKDTSLQWALFKMSLIYGGLFFFFYFQNASLETIVANGQVGGVIGALYQIFSIFPACIKFTSRLSTNTTSLLTIGMIVTGSGQVLGSALVALVGDRVRKLGQHILILSALILHITLFMVIALSFPNDAPLGHTDDSGPVFQADVIMAMTISFLLGFGDAVLQTQIYSYIAKYYQKESGTVFSIFRFASGIASTIMFFGAQYFLLVHHLTLLTVSACIAGFSILAFHKAIKKQYQDKAAVVVVSVAPWKPRAVSPISPVRE